MRATLAYLKKNWRKKKTFDPNTVKRTFWNSAPGVKTCLAAPTASGPGCSGEPVSSAVCHTGRPLLRGSVCFPRCCSSLQSRGKSGAHVSTSRVSPGRRSISVSPKTQNKTKTKTPDVALKSLLFLLAYLSSKAAGFFFKIFDFKDQKTTSGSCCFDVS